MRRSAIIVAICMMLAALWLVFGGGLGVDDARDAAGVPALEDAASPGDVDAAGATRADDEAKREEIADAPDSTSLSVTRPSQVIWFDLVMPRSVVVEDLELWSIDDWGRSHRRLGEARPPADAGRGLGATVSVTIAPYEGQVELRTRDRCWSSGVFRLSRRGDREGAERATEVVPIGLLPIARIELATVDIEGRAVDLTSQSDRIAIPMGWNQRQEWHGRDGRSTAASFAAVLEATDTAGLVTIERCPRSSIEVSIRHPSFEPRAIDVALTKGMVTELRLTLIRRPVAGTLAGRVVSRSGRSPDPRRLTGVVRIVAVEDRHQQFNVDLEWVDGVAVWESAALPFGDYRVWIGDTGSLHVSPHGERILTPPRTGIDWTWNDTAERRIIGIEVFDSGTGVHLEDVPLETWRSPEDHYATTIDSPATLRECPVDSPWRWVVGGSEHQQVELRIGDFDARRTIPSSANGAPEDVWFARVDLVSKPGR